MEQAYTDGDTATLTTLLRDHRLQVKPFVEQVLAESMRADVHGAAGEAAARLALAEAVAARFESVFGETSLTTAVAYVAAWTPEQLRVKLRADSLHARGTALRGASDTREDALARYEEALTLYRSIGDERGVAETLGGIGYIHWFVDGELYLSYNQQALEARRAVDDRQLIGNSLNDVGLAYRVFYNDYEQALAYYLESEALRIAIGDSVALGRLLRNIALCYEATGDFDQALTHYERSATVNQAIGDQHRQAGALLNAGAVLTDYLGRHSDALGYFRRALAVWEALDDPVGVSDMLNWIGIVHRRLGDYEAALTNYQRVIRLAQDMEDDERLARAYMNLGVVYLHAERPERATTYFERALERFEAVGDPYGMMDAAANLGSSHFEQGQYEAAETYLQQALTASRTLQNKMAEGSTLTTLGNVQNYAGRLDEALANYRTVLALADELGAPEMRWYALLGLGDNYERRGAYETAIKYYEQAFETLEGTRGALHTEEDKAGFLAQQRYAYEAVTDLLSRLHAQEPGRGYADLAFHYAERAKARAFLDLLAEALANVQAGVDPDLRQHQQTLLERIAVVRQDLNAEAARPASDEALVAELREELAGLEADYQILERDLRSQNPEYSELQYPQPSTLADVQTGLLEDDTVLLEYALGDSSSTLWVITRESAELVRLPDRAYLEEQVELLRIVLTNPERNDPQLFARASHRLYQILVQPAEDHIGPNQKLLIIPDGVLYYLPFEVLLTEPTRDAAAFTGLAYLIRRHAVSYGQSASVLQRLREDRRERERPDQKQFLAFGDPVFGEADDSLPEPAGTLGSGLARLPYSGTEVQTIAQFFSEDQADVFLRGDATEKQAKTAATLAGYRYIHFATHGLINERRPDFSSVVLTHDAASGEDGFLQAAEIFNLELDADLVVLSACETGLGKMVRGEGLVGLTRAFMYAGVPTLVVSLWRVADLSTSRLMEQFYAHLVEQQRSKTEALRLAKVAMLEDDTLAHPFNWAPFIMVGDWQ